MIYLIIFLGFVLRLISLNQSLWLDEATTAIVSKMSFSTIFTSFLPGDFHPPFYYLLMKLWVSLFGNSEISLRIPSVIFGVGTIYVVYLIAKKMFNGKAALMTASLTATSGLLIYYSQEARMYMMAAFLVSSLFYYAENKKWFLFSVILAILGLTDYVALLILPVFWIIYKKDFKILVKSHIPLVTVFGIWLPTFLVQLKSGSSLSGSLWWQILGIPNIKNFALIPAKFILGRISFDNRIFYGLVLFATSILFAYALCLVRKAPKQIWLWLFLPVILGILLSFKIPTLTYFRFLFCLPALYILTSGALSKAGKFGYLIFLVLFMLNILFSGYYLLSPKFHREDWRSAVAFVESQKDDKSITIFAADSNMEAYRYYAPGAKIAGPKAIKSGYNQIWLMRYVREIFDPEDLARKTVENLGYKKSREFNFNGVVVWEYIPNEKTYAYLY